MPRSLLVLTLRFSFLLLLLLLLAPQEARGQEISDLLERLEAYPELIVVNGKIAVMDEQLTTVAAMAVRDRRILVLGSTDEINELKGPETQVIDVKGRTVLPGIIDSLREEIYRKFAHVFKVGPAS